MNIPLVNGRTLRCQELDRVPVPWSLDIPASFEVESAELNGLMPANIKLPNYHLGCYGDFLCGVIKSLAAPAKVVKDPAQLLHDCFAAYQEEYVHPGTPIRHALIFQLPEGHPGAGIILIRNATELIYGKAAAGVDFVTKTAIARERAPVILGELGFVKKPEDSTRKTEPLDGDRTQA